MSREVIIMVAPNGARKTKTDHEALPISIADTVAEASACFTAGAAALHAHVRGPSQEHVLDVGLYRELIAEMSVQVPDMLVQITTEAVGIYQPDQQIACIEAVKPQMASVSLREISTNFTQTEVPRQFFSWCDAHRVHIQHILYSADELQHFFDYRERGIIPGDHRCVLFVLGRYRADFQSEPTDLYHFLIHDLDGLDWFTCAFGHREQACVMAAIAAGGHARIGFENNLIQANGELAPSTAAQVENLVAALGQQDYAVAPANAARQRLGIRNA